MCGRFVLMTPGKSLTEHFRLAEEPSLGPRYNIAPDSAGGNNKTESRDIAAGTQDRQMGAHPVLGQGR